MHILLPFVSLFLVVLHFLFLHFFLSSDGFYDRFSFYYEKAFFFSYFFFRDLSALLLIGTFYLYFLVIFWTFVFHEESFILVDIMKTSDKIIPEWFFLTFFGFIKAVPDKFFGLVILIFFIVNFYLVNYFVIHLSKYSINPLHNAFNINLFVILAILGKLSTTLVILFPVSFLLATFTILCFAILMFKCN